MLHATLKNTLNEDICIQVSADNHAGKYLVDCGIASCLSVADCQDTTVLFITHTHIDHFIGFDNLIRHQIGTKKRYIICGFQGIAAQVQHKLRGYTWNLIQKGDVVYEIREIVSDTQIMVYELDAPTWDLKQLHKNKDLPLYENEVFRIDYCLLDHHLTSVAYLFTEKDKVSIDLSETEFKGGKWVQQLKLAFEEEAPEKPIEIADASYFAKDLFHLLHIKKGFRLGIILDHAATFSNHDKIATLFSGADLVLIEAYYKDEDALFAEKNAHSYASKSAEIMKRCAVKQAIPVHFSRKYNESEIVELIAAFERELA